MRAADSRHAFLASRQQRPSVIFRASMPKWNNNHGEVTADWNRPARAFAAH